MTRSSAIAAQQPGIRPALRLIPNDALGVRGQHASPAANFQSSNIILELIDQPHKSCNLKILMSFLRELISLDSSTLQIIDRLPEMLAFLNAPPKTLKRQIKQLRPEDRQVLQEARAKIAAAVETLPAKPSVAVERLTINPQPRIRQTIVPPAPVSIEEASPVQPRPIMAITELRPLIDQTTSFIRRYALIHQIRLEFTPNSFIVRLGNDREYEYPNGKFIARSFIRAGVKTLVFHESDFSAQALIALLEAAQNESISSLTPTQLQKLGFIKEVQASNREEMEQVGGIPGHFKHYTNAAGFERIMEQKKLEAQPHRKNGEEADLLYLARLSLPPTEVYSTLFMAMPEFRDRGDYVIAFDAPPEIAERMDINGIEYTLREDIPLGQVSIRFAGRNPLQELVAA